MEKYAIYRHVFTKQYIICDLLHELIRNCTKQLIVKAVEA